MRFRIGSLLTAMLALAVFTDDALSLPEGMTLPADYRLRGGGSFVITARVRGQTHRIVRRGRVRDTLTLGDGTFSIAGLLKDDPPAAGTWTESEPDVISRSYDADVARRFAADFESMIRETRAFRNADVLATMLPRDVRVRRDGRRLQGADRIDLDIFEGGARMSGRVAFRWIGRRIE